jgi:hypothetical protein
VATNRDSKQKRAKQNRAQREAREARTKAASVPADERKAKYASSAPATGAAKKGRSDRPAPERRPRLGDQPVDLETLEGNWYKKRLAVPGGRQVLTGTVLTVIITVLTVVNKYPDPDATGEAKKKLTHTFTEYYGAVGIPLVIIPLLAMFVASYFILSPNRRRIWTICGFVAVIGAVFFGIPYFFPVGFLFYAIMRANKIEGPVPGSRAARVLEERQAKAAAEPDDASDDVSDSEPVEGQ